MAKPIRRHRRRPFTRPHTAPTLPTQSRPTSGGKAPVSGWKRWLLRIALGLFVPLLLLVFLEAGLRLFSYGFPTSLLGKADDGKAHVLNENFLRQFYSRNAATGKSHPFRVPAEKPPGTVRIFILGESAAQGTPNPSFGFGRILEVILRSQYPDKKFEVFNAAMRGINSHIILPIARDCAKHQPDLFLVYMGNNEAVGLYAPGPESNVLHRHLPLIRLVQWIKSTRLGQLLTTLTGKAPPSEQNMDFFRAHRMAMDDPRRETVYSHFRANLEKICDVANHSGAKVVLSTVAVNLKDFPPLASLHRPDLTETERAQWEAAYSQGIAAEARGRHEEALHHYQAAAKLDDHFADLHFRRSRCCYALGRFDEARKHFSRARDRDALQFRADSRLNGVIRDVAANRESRGVRLMDAEQAIAESEWSDHGVPGDKLFSEHVHLRFDGDYLLARTFHSSVAAALESSLGKPSGSPLPTRQECAARLAYTDWDDLQINKTMVELRLNPPFLDQLDHPQRQAQAERALKDRTARFTRSDVQRAFQVYQTALQQRPDDWELHHNFGMLCFVGRDFATAAKHFEFEVKTFPDRIAGRLLLGAAFAKGGRKQDAVTQFQEVLRRDPGNTLAQKAVTDLASGGSGQLPSGSSENDAVPVPPNVQ